MFKSIQLAGNPFQENTYIVFDESKECVIIDPGCYNQAEASRLQEFISSQGLKPVRLLNTHCHIDHVLGNDFVHRTYGLLPEYHRIEQVVMDSCVEVAQRYNLVYKPSPNAVHFLEAGDYIEFGSKRLEVRFTPGHSPGSVSFVEHNHKQIFAGDVLFYESIGRTDLPGGDFDTLATSIRKELYVLDDDFAVHCGHGHSTTIGHEKQHNPYVRPV